MQREIDDEPQPEYEVEYYLKFYKYHDMQQSDTRVKFVASLAEHEIDTLCYLLCEYYDQHALFSMRGLTFFSQYTFVVEAIKRDYEQRGDRDDEVKKIFRLFIDNDFISQVPNFQSITMALKPYLKPLVAPLTQWECDNECSEQQHRSCLKCKATFVSTAISLMDEQLQNGWDVYFRPMLGVPLLFFMVLKSDFSHVDTEVFSVDNIITNTLLQFLYNLLCDKATPMYWNWARCKPLILNARKYVLTMKDYNLEHLLPSLNSYTYTTKVYAPLKQFTEQHFKRAKEAGKLVHKLFIAFFLRIYLEAAKSKTRRAYDLEMRNVCRVIFRDYTDDQLNELMTKLEGVKCDLAVMLCTNLVMPKECVVQLFNKHHLEVDIGRLIKRTTALM